MITLKTITTIELSSICNLSCEYCVNRLLVKHPARDAGIMSEHIFDLSLSWLKKLCDMGTQKEVHLNGNGESLLDPNFIERAHRVKHVMGGRLVNVCTNGIALTEKLVHELKGTGIQVDMSVHAPARIRKVLKWYKKAGLKGCLNPGAITMPHNWAGQLEKKHCVEIDFKILCDPLIESRGYISSEGYVSPCCYDYQLMGAFGHVADLDLLELPITDFKLCEGCHQTIPQETMNEIHRGLDEYYDDKHHRDVVALR